MSENPVSADPWGLPVEPSPAAQSAAAEPVEQDPEETPQDSAEETPQDSAEETPQDSAEETAEDSAEDTAPDILSNDIETAPADEFADGSIVGDGPIEPDSSDDTGRAFATDSDGGTHDAGANAAPPAGVEDDAGRDELELTTDGPTPAADAIDQLIPEAGATAPDPDFHMALPSTPEPFIQITSANDQSADASEHADPGEEDGGGAEAGTDEDLSGLAAAFSAGLGSAGQSDRGLEASNDTDDSGETIADEISSLSAALAGDAGDFTVEPVIAHGEEEPDEEPADIADPDSLMAAIDQLGGSDAELEVVSEPGDPEPAADDAASPVDAALTDTEPADTALFDAGPADAGLVDTGDLLNGSLDALTTDDDGTDEPAIAWTPEVAATHGLFGDATDPSTLFSDEVAAPDQPEPAAPVEATDEAAADAAGGERATTESDAREGAGGNLGGFAEVSDTDQPGVVFGPAPAEPTEADVAAESIAQHLGTDSALAAGDMQSQGETQPVAETAAQDPDDASSVIDDIPDELPSWAVDHSIQADEPPAEAPDSPSSAEEAVQAAESLWMAPEAAEPASGLDAPLSSQPVPSVYRELETLPPPPGGRDRAAAAAPDAESLPTDGAAPDEASADGRDEPEPVDESADSGDVSQTADAPSVVGHADAAAAAGVAADPFASGQPLAADVSDAEPDEAPADDAAVDAPVVVDQTDASVATEDQGDDTAAGEDQTVEDEAAAESAIEELAGAEAPTQDPAQEAVEDAVEDAAGETVEAPGPVPAGGEPLPAQWASRWAESAQGWVDLDGDGSPSEWRPIVATVGTISGWTVETYLGLVSGDARLGDHDSLAAARDAATTAMVEESLVRGAHAVIGVSLAAHEIDGVTVVTATGTAVTLNPSN